MVNVINHMYEFGSFRVDPARRLLLKDGEVVGLVPKVFDTLLVLVTSGGEVVEKEELMRKIWGGAVVEEVGLAKNISALRKALGETPGEHRYIVTVPGRGYCFVAEVRTVEKQEGPAVGNAKEDQAAETSPESHPADGLRPLADLSGGLDPASKNRRRLVVGGVLAVVLAAVTGWLFWKFHARPALTAQDTVVLADFTNQTGDPVFDDALKQGLAVQLEQSPFLNIFPESRVQSTLQFMDLPADQRVTPAVARQICERQGAKALIAGSIAALGSEYVITLEALDGHNGETLGRAQVEAAHKEQVLKALSEAASRLRAKLGESFGSIKRYDALLEVTTPSLEALKAYSLGDHERRKAKWHDATSLFRRATELDPNFAYAYAALASIYRNRHERNLARECAAKAYALKNRASERERLLITSLYYEYVTGDLDRQIETLKLHVKTYPRDSQAHHQLAIGYEDTGQLENAVDESRIAMQLDPNSANRYSTLGIHLLRECRYREADGVFHQAIEQKLDDTALHHGLFRLAIVHGDPAAAERELRWAGSYGALAWQAEQAEASGQYRRSNEYAQRAIDAALAAGAKEVAGSYAAEAALRSALLDRCVDTGSLVAQALALERNQISLSRAALAHALCGEAIEANKLGAEIGREYPADTLLNGIWSPAIRAATELKRGDPASALQTLEPARRYEAGAYFWPQYLRGEAYLKVKKSAEAMAEFRKIRDQRGRNVTSVLYSLSQLGLARGLAQAQDVAGAQKAFQVFLAEWGQADSDLPPLAQAKAERDVLH